MSIKKAANLTSVKARLSSYRN